MRLVTRRLATPLLPAALVAVLLSVPGAADAKSKQRTVRAAASAPTVDWRAPGTRATITGRLTESRCAVTVRAPRGVRSVQLIVDGGRTLKPIALKASAAGRWACSWDSTSVADGRHRFTAKVTDKAGRSARDTVANRAARKPAPPVVTSAAAAPAPPVPAQPGAPQPAAAAPAASPAQAQAEPQPERQLGDCRGEPAAYPARLHSEAPSAANGYDVSRAFVDPNGCKVVLNGFDIFALWPSSPPKIAFDQKHYDSIKAKGFNAVRVVLPWKIYEPEQGRFAHLAELDRVVQYARNAGLYVVFLNIVMDHWNSPPAWTGWTEAMGHEAKVDYVERHSKGWLQEVAQRYRHDNTVAGYDVANELPGSDQNRILRVYDRLISYVREVDPDKVVITGAMWGNTSMAPKFVDPSNLTFRRNVVHSWHDYFAGDGNGATTSAGYNQWGMNSGNQTWDGTKGYPNPDDAPDFEAQVKLQSDYARRAGVAVYIGEYGINPRSPNAIAWAKQKAALYDKAGLSRTWWLYDCKDSGFAPRNADCSWHPIVDSLV